MAKIKLELRTKTPEEVLALGRHHRNQMVGNTNFPTPNPTAAVYDPKVTALETQLTVVEGLETALAEARTLRDNYVASLAEAISKRALDVQNVSGGDAAMIQSAGFEIQSEGTPTTSMPQPQNMRASMGDKPGEMDLIWNAVPKAKMYELQCQEHPDSGSPTPWEDVKSTTRSRYTITGLVSGKKYAFRVRALGPNDTESPWSDEAVCMSP